MCPTSSGRPSSCSVPFRRACVECLACAVPRGAGHQPLQPFFLRHRSHLFLLCVHMRECDSRKHSTQRSRRVCRSGPPMARMGARSPIRSSYISWPHGPRSPQPCWPRFPCYRSRTPAPAPPLFPRRPHPHPPLAATGAPHSEARCNRIAAACAASRGLGHATALASSCMSANWTLPSLERIIW